MCLNAINICVDFEKRIETLESHSAGFLFIWPLGYLLGFLFGYLLVSLPRAIDLPSLNLREDRRENI